jgi:hypothetical protein
MAKAEKNADLRYESIAIALHMKKGSVTVKNINRILREQETGGCWYNHELIDASSEHTTILALWALFEWRYPNRFAKWR